MAKRPRKPRSPIPPAPVAMPLLDLVASARPAAVATRERSWTVAVADDLLTEFPGSPADQAAELRDKAESYEDGPEAALAIAEEMDRRARAGVRLLPGSKAALRLVRANEERTVEGRQDHPPGDDVDPPSPED